MANTYITGVDGFNANTPEYNTLINKIYDWSNRDIEALPAQVVRDSVRYAVDTTYRTLRIPPLENTIVYNNTPVDADGNGPLDTASIGEGNIYQSVTGLAIPPDLIEFIHIRGRDANGLTTRVFNEKTDIRSFWDICNNHYNQTAFWSRQNNSVVLTPSFGNVARGFYGGGSGPEAAIEMYYYRRLPALNAQFEVTPVNFTAGLLRRFDNSTTVLTDTTTFTTTNDPTTATLFFDPNFSVTPGNFALGRLTFTGFDTTLTNNGSLFFRPNDFVNAANWLEAFQAFTQVDVGTGVPLYFDPIQQEDRFTATAGQTVFTGTVQPEDVTDVNNNGLTVIINDVATTDFVAEIVNNRIQVTLNTPATAGDIVLLDYNEFIANPLVEHVAGLVHDEQSAAGDRQRLDFILNTEDTSHFVSTWIMTSMTVTTSQSGDFTLQIYFLGNDRGGVAPDPADDIAYTGQNDANNRITFMFVGKEVPNWFKNENEKIPLMGALGEVFAYLQEDDQAAKYLQLMASEIDNLNNEDRVRDASGGNVQTQYTANGLI